MPQLDSAPPLIRRQRKVQADWGEIEEFLGRTTRALATAPFSICLVSDASIRRYNARFRGKDEATDVLSFPAGNQEPRGRGHLRDHAYLGDILISAEMARHNAGIYGVRLEDEIKALILHGLLHLLGQDHERDHGQMARSERLWGARLGLPATLLARSQSGSQKFPAEQSPERQSKSPVQRSARRLRIAGKR
jgi:probable rRNA maturation factor